MEYLIKFERSGKVTLTNVDDKRDSHNMSDFGLNREEHDGCYIDEDDIEFIETQGRRGAHYRVKSIHIEGELFKQKGKPQKSRSPKKSPSFTKDNRMAAVAPFNFIPLNWKVCEIPKDASDHSIYYENKRSGFIDYEVENLTDLFIREQNGKSDFFGKMLNRERIPGSSMRGLIRTLFEIITYSKIGEIELSRRFFNRRVGKDESRYKDRILDNQRAGWICRRGRKYILVEADKISGEKNYLKVAVESNASKRDGKFQGKVIKHNDLFLKWRDKNISEKEYTWKDIFSRIERGRIKEISLEHKHGFTESVLFQTGHIFSKKHQYIIGRRSENGKEKCATASINLNGSDDLRANRYQLMEKLKKKESKWYPCFYIEETFEGKTEYMIGETPMFRLPYESRVEDMLPKQHWDIEEKKENGIEEDLAISVFGSTKKATKVYFEDALVAGQVEYEAVTGIKMLSSPKPTSFKLYAKDGKSYDEDTIIRGNKMYWHRKGFNYKVDYSTIGQDKIQQYSKEIKPIKKATFRGRVRFDNLSNEALGALLFIFNLPDTMALKLGMGKPYGMGSVKIKNCKLTIIDRPKRYAKIFSEEGNWNTASSTNTNIEDYLNAYINFISKLDPQITSRDNFFQSDRMSHLAAMLTFDHGIEDWIEKTRYMEIERPVKDAFGNVEMKPNGKKKTKDEFDKSKPLNKPKEYLDQ